MGRVKKPMIWMMIVAMFMSGGWFNFLVPTASADDHGNSGGNVGGHVIYVKEQAPEGGDGTSWDQAFRSLQDALDEAEARASAAQPIDIWVAAGTYVPEKVIEGDRPSFQMLNHVTIYGGFPENASGGIGMSSRNWEQHQTILSGDLDRNDGPFDEARLEKYIALTSDLEDNAWNVVLNKDGLQLDETAVLDGVVVTGGVNQSDYRDPYRKGAGIYNGTENSPIIRNVIITENLAVYGGAGIYNGENSHLTLENVIVSRNSLYTTDNVSGGGIESEGKLTIFDSKIMDNFASFRGGGIYSLASNSQLTGLTMERSVVSGNVTARTDSPRGPLPGGGRHLS